MINNRTDVRKIDMNLLTVRFLAQVTQNSDPKLASQVSYWSTALLSQRPLGLIADQT